MLKARTNHLSSCEGSWEEDLHMVERGKKKKGIKPTPPRRGTKWKGGGHLFSNREPQSLSAILPTSGKSQRWGEQRAILSARSKTSYLVIQTEETKLLAKFLRCHFYQHGIFIIRRIRTFMWPFCFLVYDSLLIKKKKWLVRWKGKDSDSHLQMRADRPAHPGVQVKGLREKRKVI